MKLHQHRTKPTISARTTGAPTAAASSAALPTAAAQATSAALTTPLSPLSPLLAGANLKIESRSIDARRTPVPLSLLTQILATTASQAHLTAIAAKADPATNHMLQAGGLTLDGFFRLAATSHFGDAAKAPVTYAAFRSALSERGLAAEWRGMLDVMPAALRDKHLAGKASPLELYSSWAADRASWRARVEPVALQVVRHELSIVGRGHDLDRALQIMTPGQRGRLEAGVMKPAEISDLLQDASTREADVIIVGAGMAGLAAAQDLMRQGLTVIVLEASDRIGGRTKNNAVGDITFDQGAAWIHATDENPLTPIVQRLGLEMIPNDAPLLAYGGRHDPITEGEHLNAVMEEVHHRLSDAAKHGIDVAASQLPMPPSPYMQIAQNTIGALTMGVDWKDMSTLDVGSQPAEVHGAESVASPDMFVKEGMETVTQSFMHGVPVRLQTPVSNVKWGAEGVVVDAGTVRFAAKKILMTASTGMLASGRIGFDPPLPDWKQQAVADVPMATYDKIAIRFDKDVFTDKGVAAGAFVYEVNDETAMDIVIRPTDKNVVVGLIGGSYGDALKARGQDAAKEALLTKLERIYGSEIREHVTDVVMTDWRADPWALGSFTATKPGVARAREKLRAPVDETLFFAGEAQHMRWGGMLPAAYLTGKQAAAEMASALTTAPSTSSAPVKLAAAKVKLRIEQHAAV